MNGHETPSPALRAPSPPLGEREGVRGCGSWRAIGQYANKGVQEFVPPSHGEQDDWVLVLDAMP